MLESLRLQAQCWLEPQLEIRAARHQSSQTPGCAAWYNWRFMRWLAQPASLLHFSNHTPASCMPLHSSSTALLP